MFELEGKYTSAVIMTDCVEEAVIKQAQNLCNHPLFDNKKIVFMPDVHPSVGTCVGLSAEIDTHRIIPWLIGSDAGCMVSATKISGKTVKNFDKLDKVIKNLKNSDAQKIKFMKTSIAYITSACKELKFNPKQYINSLGSIGSGNHFISIEKGKTGTYLIIHSGSRNFGRDIQIYYGKKALEQNPYTDSGELKQLSWLDKETSFQYQQSLITANTYSQANQFLIIETLCKEMKWDKEDTQSCFHNYIERTYPNEQPSWDNNWSPENYNDILHKGSISLKKDELGIIPINMAYGSFIVKGKGNAEWNNSAPHGAGRVFSRTKAKESLSMEEFKKSMKGVYSTCISTGTLDEAPMAYKNGDEIKELITPTAEIIDHLIPMYNFKAS